MWRVTAARKAPASLSPTVAYRPLQCFKGALAQATEFSGDPGWADTRIKQHERQARPHDADPGHFHRAPASGAKRLTMWGAEGGALVPAEAPPPIDIRFA